MERVIDVNKSIDLLLYCRIVEPHCLIPYTMQNTLYVICAKILFISRSKPKVVSVYIYTAIRSKIVEH